MQVPVRQIGIFGGSFNPVHCGHMMVASYLASWAGLDEVWLTLTPQNPLKKDLHGASDLQRLHMLKVAAEGSEGLRVCDEELSLPRPTYTITTLRHLSAKYPGYRFHLIIGADNWAIFHKWREAEEIISRFGVIVYPRPGFSISTDNLPAGVRVADAPICSLSSTFIRNSIASGHSVEHMVPSQVLDYIKEKHLYT